MVTSIASWPGRTNSGDVDSFTEKVGKTANKGTKLKVKKKKSVATKTKGTKITQCSFYHSLLNCADKVGWMVLGVATVKQQLSFKSFPDE